MKKRSILATAVALTLSGASSVMAANIDLGASSITPAYFASELPDSTSVILSGGFTFSLPVPNYAVDTNNPFFISIALNNGAQFNTALNSTGSISCMARSAGEATSSSYDLSLQVGGGASTNNATFQLQATAGNTRTIVAQASGCELYIPDIKMTSGLKDISISAVISYIDGFTTITTSYVGTFISYKNALKMTYTPATDATVDVTQSSTQFIVGNTNKNTAYLGSVSYANIMPAPATNESQGALTVGSVIADDGKLTLVSPAFGAVNSGSGGVYLASTNTCADSAIGSLTKATGTTVTFSSITAAEVLAGVHVCLKVDGNTAISKGTVGASFVASAQPGFGKNYRPSFGVASFLANIVKNGATVKVLNVPNPNVVDQAFIRINNMSAQAGRILGTLYGQDGVQLGTAGVELANLTAYQATVLDVTAIKTLFGVTTWTGRAWLQIDAEVSNVAVQGLIRTSDGTLTNMSDGAAAVGSN
ncbi:hypothetical protein BegalDRAFT_2322 [Beggiatoa alba B18LD]|uniref:Uncharacterized protein n=1 Tax=Beggiatoa alba B18LD TaxID=395493 RepID=I3CHT3_9GAMM|nr:hypothetical protein [Beggiatoa alba]EIJ43176.1 hypothetical protein BegalDRAFT_2322 [Beggiatoa alba B18LD]